MRRRCRKGNVDDGVTSSDDSCYGEPQNAVETVQNILNMFSQLTSEALDEEEGKKKDEGKCGNGGEASPLGKDQGEQMLTSDDLDEGQEKGDFVSAVTDDHQHQEGIVVLEEDGGGINEEADKGMVESSSVPITISQFQPLEKWSIKRSKMLDKMKINNLVQGDKGKNNPIKLFSDWDVLKPLAVQKPNECQSSGKGLAKVLKDLGGPPLRKRKAASSSSSALVRTMVGGAPAIFTGPPLDGSPSPTVPKNENVNDAAIKTTNKDQMLETGSGSACPTQSQKITDIRNSDLVKQMKELGAAFLAKQKVLSSSGVKHVVGGPLVSGIDKPAIIAPKEDEIPVPVVLKKMSKREAKKLFRKANGTGSSMVGIVKKLVCSIPLSQVKLSGGEKCEKVIESGLESQIESGHVTTPKAKKVKGRRARNQRTVRRKSTKETVSPVLKGKTHDVKDSSSELPVEDDSTLPLNQGNSEVESKEPVTHEEEHDNMSQSCEVEKEVEEEPSTSSLFPKIAMRGKSESLSSKREPVVEYDDDRRVLGKGKIPSVEKIGKEDEEVFKPFTKEEIKKNTKCPTAPFNDALKKKVDLKEKASHKEPPHLELLNSDAPEIVEFACQNHFRLIKHGFIKYELKGFEKPSNNWLEEYRQYKWNGKDGFRMTGSSKLITIAVQQIWRVKGHLFYTCTVSGKDAYDLLPCVRSNTLGEIADAFEELLGGDTDEDKAENFWRRLYQLKSSKTRSGTGLLIPYINVFDYVDVEGSTKSLGFNMNELKSPLRDDLKFEKNGELVNNGGITDSMTYFGFPMSFFCLHIEDSCYNSLNVNRGGCTKVWYIVPPSHYEELVDKLRVHYGLLTLPDADVIKYFNESCRLHHKHDLVTPRVLEDWNIPFKIVYQKPGEVIVLASRAAHFGMNLGISCGYAANAICSDFHSTCWDGLKQCPHNYVIPVVGNFTPALEAQFNKENPEERYFILTEKFKRLQKASAHQYARNIHKSTEEGLIKMKELEVSLGLEESEDEGIITPPPSSNLDLSLLPTSPHTLNNETTQGENNEMDVEGEMYYIHVDQEEMPRLFPELSYPSLPPNAEVVMEEGNGISSVSTVPYSSVNFPSSPPSLFSSSTPSSQSEAVDEEFVENVDNGDFTENNHEEHSSRLSPSGSCLYSLYEQLAIVEEKSADLEESVVNGNGNETLDQTEDAADEIIPSLMSDHLVIDPPLSDTLAKSDYLEESEVNVNIGNGDETTDREESAPNIELSSPACNAEVIGPILSPSSSPKLHDVVVEENSDDLGKLQLNGDQTVDLVESAPNLVMPSLTSNPPVISPRTSPSCSSPHQYAVLEETINGLEQSVMNGNEGETSDRQERAPDIMVPSPLSNASVLNSPLSPSSSPPRQYAVLEETYDDLEQLKVNGIIGNGGETTDREGSGPNIELPSPASNPEVIARILSPSSSPKLYDGVVEENSDDLGKLQLDGNGDQTVDLVESAPNLVMPYPTSNPPVISPRTSPSSSPPRQHAVLEGIINGLEQSEVSGNEGETPDRQERAPNIIVPSPLSNASVLNSTISPSSSPPRQYAVLEETIVDLEQPEVNGNIGNVDETTDREESAPNIELPSPASKSEVIARILSPSSSPPRQYAVLEEAIDGLVQSDVNGNIGNLGETPSPTSNVSLMDPVLSSSSSLQRHFVLVEKYYENIGSDTGEIEQAVLGGKPEGRSESKDQPNSEVVFIPRKSSRTPVSIQLLQQNVENCEDDEESEEDADDDDDEFGESISKAKKKGRKQEKKKMSKDPTQPRREVKKPEYDTAYWVKHAKTQTAEELVTPVEVSATTMTSLNGYRRGDKLCRFTGEKSRWQCPECPKSYTTEKACKKHIEKGNEHTFYGRCARKGCTGFYNGPATLITHSEWHWEKDKECGVTYNEDTKTYSPMEGDPDKEKLLDILFARIDAYRDMDKLRNEEKKKEAAKKAEELEIKRATRGKKRAFLQSLEKRGGKRRKKSKKNEEDS